jgi:multiple sugar transport system permease protein
MAALLNILGRTPRARRKALWGLALIAPNTIGLFIFFGIPVLVAFGLSFFEWNGIRPPEFVGLENFARILRDPLFGRALANTLILALIVIPLNMALALGAAVLLNQRLRLRNLFRTIYFLPVVTSTVAASVVWTWVFQPSLGLIGVVPGLGSMQWLTRPELVLIPIAAVTVWQRIGFDMILFLAGLQNVPRVLQEAAVIDGANRRQRFFRVTLPLLSPTTFLVLTLNFISVFQIFDQVYIMTQRTTPGGVSGSATTLTFLLYQTGFVRSQFGYASAIALALFFIVLSITVIQLRLQRRWVFYESEAG